MYLYNHISKFVVLFILFTFVSMIYSQDDFFESSSTIGGYGELHYNNNLTTKQKTLDFHRFVLFYSHNWTETWSLYSEVELEHNFVKAGEGELELEQAYINFHPVSYFGFRVGVVLASIGVINEYHEPPLFLSTERPEYATYIIPTTWFGNGLSIFGNHNGFDYKITIMEGLNGDKISLESGIRSARQKGYKANAQHLLYTYRLDYLGIMGAKLGISYSINKANSTKGTIGIGFFETHFEYKNKNIWSIFELGNIEYDAGDLKSSFGYYFDIGYNMASLLNIPTEIIPWFRWTDYNTAKHTRTGINSEKMYHFKKWMIGVAIKPISSVVFKLDFGISERQLDSRENKSINLGAGYMF